MNQLLLRIQRVAVVIKIEGKYFAKFWSVLKCMNNIATGREIEKTIDQGYFVNVE